MRYGILASPLIEPPAPSTETIIDFVNGSYTVLGITQTAGQVVDDVGRISASGLSIIGSTPITFLGDFADLIATTNYTLIFDIMVSFSGPQRVTYMETVDNTFLSIIQLMSFAGFLEAYDDNGAGASRDLNTGNSFTPGTISRFAYTRTNARSSISLNGGSVETDGTIVANINVEAVQGASGFAAGTLGYIQRIEIIDPVANILLPDYSEPPPQDVTLAAGSGSFSLSGTAATIRKVGTVVAEAGTYTLTGASAALVHPYSLTAGAGSYALTGTAAGLMNSYALSAGAGSFVLSGTAATLTHALAADPLFSLVVFLTDGEGNDGDTTITDQSSFAHVMTTAGAGTQVSNTHAEYGSTSIKSHNTTPFSAPDSNAWDISSNNSDEFCVEYSYYQTDRGSTYDVYAQLPGGGNYAWLSRHNGADWTLFWSSDGSSFQTLTAVGGVGTANAWHKYCIEKNSSGKLRMYLDGAMLTSSTPADSTIHHSSGSMFINASGAAQDAWFDNGRITKGASGSGAARYNNDSGYTPATQAFPTS